MTEDTEDFTELPPKQLIEIRHTNPDNFLHWEIIMDGKRVENMTGFKLEVGMDFVPQLTIKVHAVDLLIESAKWDPTISGVVWGIGETLPGAIERDQDASPDPWEGKDVHQQD